MLRLTNFLGDNLIIRSVSIYSLIALPIIFLMPFAQDFLGLSPRISKTVVQLTMFNYFPVCAFAWMIQPAAKPDRWTMLIRILWMYGPLVVIPELVVFVVFAFIWRTGTLLIDLILLTAIFVALAAWQGMSSPFARSWALRRAVDPTKIMEAERRVHYPNTPKEIGEGEIHVDPKFYYGLISALTAVVLISADALLGEFVDNTLGMPGYLGAIAIAFVVSAVMYPVHRKASRILSSEKAETEDAADNIQSALPEVHRAFTKSVSNFLRHRVVAFLTIVCATTFVWLTIVFLPKMLLQ